MFNKPSQSDYVSEVRSKLKLKTQKPMKPLLILTFMAISLFSEPAFYVDSDQGLEMQLTSDIQFKEKVKIFDYDGNMLEEHPLSDVVNDKMSEADYYTLAESDYAFNYLGDYYYFTDELERLGAN